MGLFGAWCLFDVSVWCLVSLWCVCLVGLFGGSFWWVCLVGLLDGLVWWVSWVGLLCGLVRVVVFLVPLWHCHINSKLCTFKPNIDLKRHSMKALPLIALVIRSVQCRIVRMQFTKLELSNNPLYHKYSA